MTKCFIYFGGASLALLLVCHETRGIGFGGFHGGFGGFHGGGGWHGFGGGGFGRFQRNYGIGNFFSVGYGGYREGGYGGYRNYGYGGYRDYYGGYRGYGYGERSYGSAWGSRGGYASGSYDRSYTGERGGTVSVEGSRGVAAGPRGVAAGGTREVTATGAGGRSFSGEASRGGVAGPGGFVAGRSRSAMASGPRGTASASSRRAAAGVRVPSDWGLGHYANIGVAGASHVTRCWSNGEMANRANWVRAGWNRWDCFGRGWWGSHPGCWGYGIAWAAGDAWTWATWPTLATWWSIPATPIYYDYGTNVVYEGDNVYINGTDAGTAEQYSEQAANIAAQGTAANPGEAEKWQPLGVFALVQGDETTSNTIFQLAADQNGIIRGNYFDALTDATTPVKGAIDKKTQRAAWTIGDQKNTVFETGVFNLTKDKTPVLVHVGKDRTEQWLLVRLTKPDQS